MEKGYAEAGKPAEDRRWEHKMELFFIAKRKDANAKSTRTSRLRSKTSMATTHRCDELLPVVVSTVQFSAAAGLAPSS